MRKETAEAKAALMKAEAARKRAQKELREAGNGSGFFNSLARSLGSRPAPKRRTTTKRKPAKRKSATRKSTIKKRASSGRTIKLSW